MSNTSETSNQTPPIPPPIWTPIVIDDDIGPIRSLQAFNMRNGDVSLARSLFIKSELAPMWHWSPIQNLPPKMAISQTPAFIKCALANMMANKPASVSDALARKQAILVGVAGQ